MFLKLCPGFSDHLVDVISFDCTTTSRSILSRFFGHNSVKYLSRDILVNAQIISGDLATLTGGFRTYFLRAGWRGASNGFSIFTIYFSCSLLSKMGIYRIRAMRKKGMKPQRAPLACKSNSSERFW